MRRALAMLTMVWCLAAAAEGATFHDYSDQALQSFLLKFWKGGDQYFHHTYPDNGSLTGYWTYANGWEAVMDNVERTSKREYYNWIETLYIGQNERGWGANYYDDLCWMTVALIRAYDLTGDTKYLDRAKSIFVDVQAAWDVSCCGSPSGGVWWDRAHTQKATASNAGAALVAARLFRRTGTQSYLDFARQVYNFWYQNMVNLSTGQVADHVTPAGEKVWWKFTYNEGLMIAAAMELNEATGEAPFLAQAYLFGSFVTSNEILSTAYGAVLHDGSSASCTGDCAQFKGPAVRALARLYAKDRTRSGYGSIVQASANGVWNLARKVSDTTFATSWGGPPEDLTEMTEQNSAVTALSRDAQLFQAYTPMTNLVFEAEEGVIHHIPLENIYVGFSGWGYLAAWNHDGQSVDFPLEFATAGTRTLRFRFAAGAGDATRTIRVNGVAAVSNLKFTGTGAWSSYGTMAQPLFLNAGKSVVSISFESGFGNQNWLNLDSMSIDGYTLPAPGKLTVSALRPNLVLNWNGLGTLQSGTAIDGPWADVTGNPASPATLAAPTFGARYHRLRQ